VTLLFGVLAIRRLRGTASQKLTPNAERSVPLASQA
jgi:hypothetical protein